MGNVCGHVEQGETQHYTLVDFMHRKDAVITYRLHVGEEITEEQLPQIEGMEGWFTFNLTITSIGTHMIEFLLDDQQIEDSPLFFEVVTKTCGEDRTASAAGVCECSAGTIAINDGCQQLGTFIPIVVVPVMGGAIIIAILYVVLPKLGFDQDALFSCITAPLKFVAMTIWMGVCAILVLFGFARPVDGGAAPSAINVRKKKKKDQEKKPARGRLDSVIGAMNKLLNQNMLSPSKKDGSPDAGGEAVSSDGVSARGETWDPPGDDLQGVVIDSMDPISLIKGDNPKGDKGKDVDPPDGPGNAKRDDKVSSADNSAMASPLGGVGVGTAIPQPQKMESDSGVMK